MQRLVRIINNSILKGIKADSLIDRLLRVQKKN